MNNFFILCSFIKNTQLLLVDISYIFSFPKQPDSKDVFTNIDNPSL